jgi:hypothetical protein
VSLDACQTEVAPVLREWPACIDCHKGIAHTLPPIEQHVGAHKVGAAGTMRIARYGSALDRLRLAGGQGPSLMASRLTAG